VANVKDMNVVAAYPVVDDIRISAKPVRVHAKVFDESASSGIVAEALDARCNERLDLGRRLGTSCCK
jgi:hypothetical protein